jgi:Protein of unknown function (DUF3179)
MSEPSTKPRARGRLLAGLALAALALLVPAAVFIPVWIVRPFEAQSPAGMALSYALRRWNPLVTPLALAAALALIVWLWRGSRSWWRRLVPLLALPSIVAATWAARQNHFEWMFAPLPGVEHVAAAQVDFVAPADMVLAVHRNGDAAAYPVRQVAYHHVVQDVVGGVPIVVTF